MSTMKRGRRKGKKSGANIRRAKATGERKECNLCERMFPTRTRFDRFCDICRQNSVLYQSFGCIRGEI